MLPTLAAVLLLIAAASRSAVAQATARPSEAPVAAITLAAVLDSAVRSYPALASADARVRAARGTRATAGALGNPMLAYQVENTPFPGGSPTGMDREAMTTATVPLAMLYQRPARVRQADAAVRAAVAGARSTRQQVTLDAARAYYRTALAQVSGDAADNLAQWLDSVVAYNQTRVSQGVAAEADLIRSQLERDRAVADAGIAAADLARARAELSAYLGDPAAFGEIAVALDDVPLTMPSSSTTEARSPGASGTALAARPSESPDATSISGRPDVQAARERLASAGAGTALEQSMIIRELGATVGVKQTAGTSSMIAGLSLPLPLFDQNRGELARARAERDAAAFDLATQERAARAEVIGAERAARAITERTRPLAVRDSATGRPTFLARADEARTIALGAYREGAVPLLQVLDAARAWGEARVAFYRALYAQHEAVLALVVARGDDIQSVLPTLTSTPVRGAPAR